MKDSDFNPMPGKILGRVMNTAGGVVDDVFLLLPKIFRPFTPRRTVDRAVYEAEVDYYFREGVADQPETFFQFVREKPDYAVASEQPFSGGIRREISFPSLYQPKNPLVAERYLSFSGNRTARLMHWTHGDGGRKTLICLHGYLLGDPDQAERMFRVRTLFDKGLDVALFITPFHWKRAPMEKFRRGMFLQPDDVVMTLEGFGQAMQDLSSCLGILRDHGSPDIGLIGASLGGYLAGLYACLSDDIAFAALMVPAVRFAGDFSPAAARLPFAVDGGFLDRLNLLWNLHSPANFDLKIPKERVLVIAARGDKVCPFGPVAELCARWGWPRHVFLTGGHWLMADARRRGRAWYEFLAEMGFI